MPNANAGIYWSEGRRKRIGWKFQNMKIRLLNKLFPARNHCSLFISNLLSPRNSREKDRHPKLSISNQTEFRIVNETSARQQRTTNNPTNHVRLTKAFFIQLNFVNKNKKKKNSVCLFPCVCVEIAFWQIFWEIFPPTPTNGQAESKLFFAWKIIYNLKYFIW